MATESFYESLILENEEQLRILERLIDEADARPPSKPSSDVLSEIRMGKKLIEEGFFD
jgi:hypothetical protein